MIFFLCVRFYSLVWQATYEACSPAQLLQLLQPACYLETDASALAAQAHARVLIFVRTLTRAKCALREAASEKLQNGKERKAASQKQQERAVLQRNIAVGAAVSLALICIIVAVRNRR
jgi:hypothetical protein